MQIRKSGYPFRLPHNRFVARYRCTLKKGGGQGWEGTATLTGSDRDMCAQLLASCRLDGCVGPRGVAIGATMVLFRAEAHQTLELLRNLRLEDIVPICLRAARLRIGRKFRAALAAAKGQLAAVLAGARNNADELDAAIAAASAEVGPFTPIFEYEPPELKEAKVCVG